jgi:uroporphyrinogen-III synthase
MLEGMDWAGTRVLVPTTAGGRHLLADGLRAAGARVDEVEAYAMRARDPRAIAGDWMAAAPDAVVVGSARAADLLAAAIGAEPLRAERVVVAIGPATAAALARHDVRSVQPSRADFTEAARLVRACRDGAAR